MDLCKFTLAATLLLVLATVIRHGRQHQQLPRKSSSALATAAPDAKTPQLYTTTSSLIAENVRRRPTRKPFPEHWGKPPTAKTRDLRTWPGGYGRGSGTVAAWIKRNMEQDLLSDAPPPPMILPPLVKAALSGDLSTLDRADVPKGVPLDIAAAAALYDQSGAAGEAQKPPAGGYLGLGLKNTIPSAAPISTVQVAPSKGCWQNHGQACSEAELRNPYTNSGRTPTVPPPTASSVATPVHYELTLRDFDTKDWTVKYTERSSVYNPAVVSYRNQLWMVARHEGKNKTGEWSSCPNNTLVDTRPCPVHTLRMVSFNVRVAF